MSIGRKDFPSGDYKNFTLEGFEGLNTKATRPSIEDQQMAWCENWMPIGRGNLRTMYGLGTSIVTGPTQIVYAYAFNIGAVPYHFLCFSDGSAWATRIDTGTVTSIAGVGTFGVSPNLPHCCQWNNTYLQIISSTGYFIWDGSIMFPPGGIAPYSDASLVSPGQGYTSTPAVTITGTGTGATATATISGGLVIGIKVTNPGTGYTQEPLVSVSGGGTAGGSLNSIQIINGGSNYTSPPTVAFTGGGGTGATATAVMTGGSVTSFNITAAGSGYTGNPTIGFSGGGGSGAVALAVVTNVAAIRLPVMPTGLTGTCIENFQSRAWIGFSNKVAFTAPNAIANFATSAGGGIFPSNDSTLRVQFIHLQNSNGFLYLYGDSSVQVISNVQTSGSPATTTFNVSNVDPQIGSPWRDAIDVFGRGIIGLTTSGVYACYGGSVEKTSDPLDGLLLASPRIPTSGAMTQFPSAAVMNIFDIRCWMALIPITDPATSANRNALVIWDGQKWWLGSQEIPLTFIWGQEFNGVLQAWGTDGTMVYPLFANPSANLVKTLRSKLWAGDGITIYKDTFRLYGEIFPNANQSAALTVNVDNEQSSFQTNLNVSNVVQFTNSGGGAIQFQNSTPANIYFVVSGLSIPATDVAVTGRLLGLTATTQHPDETLLLLQLLYENSAIYG